MSPFPVRYGSASILGERVLGFPELFSSLPFILVNLLFDCFRFSLTSLCKVRPNLLSRSGACSLWCCMLRTTIPKTKRQPRMRLAFCCFLNYVRTPTFARASVSTCLPFASTKAAENTTKLSKIISTIFLLYRHSDSCQTQLLQIFFRACCSFSISSRSKNRRLFLLVMLCQTVKVLSKNVRFTEYQDCSLIVIF